MGDTELEAAARAVVEFWKTHSWVGGRDLGETIDRLAAALPSPPEPLKVGDTVTREHADRVPVGAILRDAQKDAWEVSPEGWWCAVMYGGFDVLSLAGALWPMTVLWLPEPSDA